MKGDRFIRADVTEIDLSPVLADVFSTGKGKVCIRAKWPIRRECIPVSVA